VIRILLNYIIPLLLPTAAYFLWLWLMRRYSGARGGDAGAAGGAEDEGAETKPVPWLWLALAGLVLMAITLFALALRGGNTPGGTYVPPHIEDGRIVPGRVVE